MSSFLTLYTLGFYEEGGGCSEVVELGRSAGEVLGLVEVLAEEWRFC